MLVMDVDGTLTDGKLYIGSDGEVMKAFSARDGLGIKKLPKYDIIPVIITGRTSKIVEYRAKEMRVEEVYQGIRAKIDVLKEIAAKYSIDLNHIAYIGDDENDLEAMQLCGIKACPADAAAAVKQIADFIAVNNGGNGAIRELIEYIIKRESTSFRGHRGFRA